jgi:hypothetical protein
MVTIEKIPLVLSIWIIARKIKGTALSFLIEGSFNPEALK